MNKEYKEMQGKITAVAVKVYDMAKGAQTRTPYEETVVRENTLKWAIEELEKVAGGDYIRH